MKKITIYIFCIINITIAMANNERYKIKLGDVVLSGLMPDKRTIRAPDIEFDNNIDICNWENLEGRNKKFDSISIGGKLWEFRRFLRTNSGSLDVNISLFNNEKFGLDYNSYFQWILQKRISSLQKTPKETVEYFKYSPPIHYKEFEKDGHIWFTFVANSGNFKSYMTMLNSKIMLRINLDQYDNRKESKKIKGKWHPKAEALAKIIIESLKLEYPKSGKACNK